jgi:hypothetical protein
MQSVLSNLARNIKQEPVMFQGLVQATLGLFLAFGLKLSPQQIGGILAFSAAFLSWVTRIQVTPLMAPRTNAGDRLVPVMAQAAQ